MIKDKKKKSILILNKVDLNFNEMLYKNVIQKRFFFLIFVLKNKIFMKTIF